MTTGQEARAPDVCLRCSATLTGKHSAVECLTHIASALVKERDAAYEALSRASVDRDELARFVMQDEARSAEWIARGAGCALCKPTNGWGHVDGCPAVAPRPNASAELVALSMVMGRIGSFCVCGAAASVSIVGKPLCDACVPEYLEGTWLYWDTCSPPGSLSRQLGYQPPLVEPMSCAKVARRFNALLAVSKTCAEPTPETEPKTTPDQGPSR